MSASLQYPPGYEKPVISAMTEKIIELRNQTLRREHAKEMQALGPTHWKNIPSGNQIFETFKSKFPNVVKDSKSTSMQDSNSSNYSHKSTSQYNANTSMASSIGCSNYPDIVRNCRVKEALRHVDAAEFLLKSC